MKSLICAVTAVTASTAQAAVTVLTFDDLGLPNNTIITDQYEDQGVIFSPQNGQLEIRTASSPIFPDEPQGLAEIPYGESVIIADFLLPTDAAGAWIDFGYFGDGVIIEVFDGPGATGNLLASNITQFEEFLGVEADGIQSVRFMKAGGQVSFLIDNFEFQSEAVCFAVVDDEITCHADGSAFTYTVNGVDACTGGMSTYTFTASGGAVGEELCFTVLVNADGGFCCTTEICVTIPDCTLEMQVCDFEALSVGDVVTNQCPGATFSSTPGNENVVLFGHGTNFICTRPVGQPQTCIEDTYVDFTNPVDSLSFQAIALNSIGIVAAQVNVFVNGSLDATVDIIGTGDILPIVDLTTFSHVTRIEIVNIIDDPDARNGIGWDNFSFNVMSELPCDLNGDGIVGMVDFLALLAAWGSCSDCGTCPADFDGDCSVGILDLLILLGSWG